MSLAVTTSIFLEDFHEIDDAIGNDLRLHDCKKVLARHFDGNR
jgi:hypothetical protein